MRHADRTARHCRQEGLVDNAEAVCEPCAAPHMTGVITVRHRADFQPIN
jgi:hypothetical protein